MSLKISEMISQRRDLARDLSAGIEANLESVAAGYEAFLSTSADEGEPPVNARQQLLQLKRSIDSNREAIEGLDDGVVSKVHMTDKVSAELTSIVERLILKLRFVRDTCRNLFGKSSLKRTALEQTLPRRPLRVAERSRLVQSSLRSPELEIPHVIDVSAADEAQAWTPDKLASSLEPETTQLEEGLGQRYMGKRESSGARSLRRQGIAEFDRQMRGIARIVQGMFVLAGRDDLVARFSTALRRFSRRNPRETVTAQPQPTPPDATSVPDEPPTS